MKSDCYKWQLPLARLNLGVCRKMSSPKLPNPSFEAVPLLEIIAIIIVIVAIIIVFVTIFIIVIIVIIFVSK